MCIHNTSTVSHLKPTLQTAHKMWGRMWTYKCALIHTHTHTHMKHERVCYTHSQKRSVTLVPFRNITSTNNTQWGVSKHHRWPILSAKTDRLESFWISKKFAHQDSKSKFSFFSFPTSTVVCGWGEESGLQEYYNNNNYYFTFSFQTPKWYK